MKTILLTKGKVALVDDEDYEFLSQWKWSASRHLNTWYAKRTEMVNGRQKCIYMHRALCSGKEIDHRDGNGLNNQKYNLRSVSHSLNCFNHGRSGKSGVRGVFWHQGRWRARICVNYKQYHLGSFDDIEDAREAYNKAAVKFFGETYER